MNNLEFFDMLGDIDDMYILEAGYSSDEDERPVAKAASSESAPRRIRPIVKTVLPIAAGIAAVALITFGFWKIFISGSQKANVSIQPSELIEPTVAVTIEETGKEETSTYPPILWAALQIPSNREVVLFGEPISDEEAKACFEEDFQLIHDLIVELGRYTTDLRMAEHGYGHISFDGVEGESLMYKQNVREYLLYDGTVLIGSIEFTKTNRKVDYVLLVGGTRFDYLDSFLKLHEGEQILFMNLQDIEIVIAPDGSIITPCTSDRDNVMQFFEKQGIEDPWTYFFYEPATYIVVS
ncbi:MAG: hypothetical protein J6Y08_04690 [Clostridiales bacterium]|nr:hypothetical protein [Clostridiales bacterium]